MRCTLHIERYGTIEIKNKPCPECRKSGADATGDHLYRAKRGDEYLPFWICRKCQYKEWDNGEPIEDTPPSNYFTMKEVSSLPSISDRGIPKAVRELYGVKSALDTATLEATHHFYPITNNGHIATYKCRDIGKKQRGEKGAFTKISKAVTSDTDLFGMKALKGTPKVVVITEGEEDAMAAYTMLHKTIHNIGVLSLLDGTGSVNSIANNLEWLSKVDKLYFSPDMDEAGQKIVEKVVSLLPDILLIQDLSEKDPNEMLKKGKGKDYINSFMRASKFKPPLLVNVSDVIADAIKLPEWGRLWPWASLNKATYGMRDGEGIYVGAGVKIGKSEFINELVMHRILQKDGDIPAVIKFEEQPAITVKKIAGKMDGTFYHKPDVSFSPKVLEATAKSLDGKFYMYRAFGQAEWSSVKNYIRYVVANGSKTVIIDPFTRLTNQLDSSQTETALRSMSDELACMAQDLGFFYIVTCHLKAPTHGIPHERGGKVNSNQFRGSRAMMESCYYMLGIERNKDPEITEEERNESTFVLLEDRAFGNVTQFKVQYDKTDGSYKEPIVVRKH